MAKNMPMQRALVGKKLSYSQLGPDGASQTRASGSENVSLSNAAEGGFGPQGLRLNGPHQMHP